MSTFDGQLREYPSIAVDRFIPRPNIRYYFLTHVHADHTQGLSAPHFFNQVHCSETTADILLRLKENGKSGNKFEHLRGRLKTCALLQPFVLDTLEYGKLNITYLPANHCPGAVMILIEGCHGNVLYTGDVRAEPAFVGEIANILGGKPINHLYMDTTFCDPATRNFITKDHSIDVLIETIESLPEGHHVYLDFWTFGFEEMWVAVAEKYGAKIHVSPDRYNLYAALNPIYTRIFSTNAAESRFHSCRWNKECRRHSHRTTTIHPVPVTGHRVRTLDPVNHLLRTDFPKSCQVRKQIALPYSFHSSFAEIIDFCKAIKPKRFTPIVAHGKKWTTSEYMLNQIRSHGAMLDVSSDSSSSKSSITKSDSSSNSAEDNLSENLSTPSSVNTGSLSDNEENIILSEEQTANDGNKEEERPLTKYDILARKWREKHLERRRKRNAESMLSSSSGTWTWPEEDGMFPELPPGDCNVRPLGDHVDNVKENVKETSSDVQLKLKENAESGIIERKIKRPCLHTKNEAPGSSIETAICID